MNSIKNFKIYIICTNCKKISFAKRINRCMYCFSKTKLVGIDGQFVNKKIIQRDFLKLDGMLNPYLISYFKKKKVFKTVAKI